METNANVSNELFALFAVLLAISVWCEENTANEFILFLISPNRKELYFGDERKISFVILNRLNFSKNYSSHIIKSLM